MPHLLEQLLRFCLELGHLLVLLLRGGGRKGRLCRQDKLLWLGWKLERSVRCLPKLCLNLLAQAVQFELELGLFVLSLISAQLCVLDSIAHQVDFWFHVGHYVSLQLIDFLSHSICHSAYGLAQDCTLTLNPLDLLVQLLGTLGMLRCRLPTLALLSISLLILHLVRLQDTHCIVQLEDFFAQGEALFGTAVGCSRGLHVSRLWGGASNATRSSCSARGRLLLRIGCHCARKSTAALGRQIWVITAAAGRCPIRLTEDHGWLYESLCVRRLL